MKKLLPWLWVEPATFDFGSQSGAFDLSITVNPSNWSHTLEGKLNDVSLFKMTFSFSKVKYIVAQKIG